MRIKNEEATVKHYIRPQLLGYIDFSFSFSIIFRLYKDYILIINKPIVTL